MKPKSAKNKGRKHQQWVRDLLLELAPTLTKDDIRSTGMGQGGEDIQLSAAARKEYPFQIECKSRAKIGVYADYKQAKEHGKYEPILVIKQNTEKPLVVMDAEWFFKLWSKNK